MQGQSDSVVLLECNLDDMTGEDLGGVLDCLLDAGALDAWFTPIYMKKNRPAVLLSVLCRVEQRAEMTGLLLQDTTTLGVRWRQMRREIAARQIVSIETAWGHVRCKLKILDGIVVSLKAEYDDCASLAKEAAVGPRGMRSTIQSIRDATVAAARHLLGQPPPT